MSLKAPETLPTHHDVELHRVTRFEVRCYPNQAITTQIELGAWKNQEALEYGAQPSTYNTLTLTDFQALAVPVGDLLAAFRTLDPDGDGLAFMRFLIYTLSKTDSRFRGAEDA